MQRMRNGVLAMSLGATAVLALVPGVAGAGAGPAGTWGSTDTDGSAQALAIGRGSTPAVTYLDFYASTCANDGSPSTQFVATGRGTLGEGALWVDFRNGRCGRHATGPFGLGFTYDAANDTLTDDFGITWHRSP